MRKIRKTRQAEPGTPILSEWAAADAFPAPAADESRPRTEGGGPAGAAEARERTHYLGAVCHAAPPLLVIEAEPMDGANPAARSAFSENTRVRARESVMNATLAACGLGLIPLPLADMAGSTLIMGGMLGTLSRLYGCSNFTWTRSAGLFLLAAFGAVGGGMAANLLLRLVPGGGWLASAAVPASMGVATYAAGMATIRHFETSGSAVPPSLSALLADVRGNRDESRRRVALFLGGGRVKA